MASCEGMAGFLARRYARYYADFPFEELMHHARISAWKSAEKWVNGESEKKRIKFSTFAYGWIRHDLYRHVLEMRDVIRVSRQNSTARQSAMRVRTVSLDEVIFEDSGANLHDLIADNTETSRYGDDEVELMERCLQTMQEKDKHVLRERYVNERSLREIAAELGMTGEAVRQRELTALRRLRQRMATFQMGGLS